MAMFTSRSKNSYMRLPRRVTLQPTLKPLRSRKLLIDWRALVITAFWPVIRAMSPAACSMALASSRALPTPMFMQIFTSRGTPSRFW